MGSLGNSIYVKVYHHGLCNELDRVLMLVETIALIDKSAFVE